MDTNLWQRLYLEGSEHYERMVQCEDYEGNLIPALARIYPLDNANVVEFSAGTGRITCQLAPRVKHIRAFDLTPPMLRIANRKLEQSGWSNWLLGLADSRAMPTPSGCADIAVEGWSFVQIMTWHMHTWREQLDRAIQEMFRVVRPGGVAILIETLGTGETMPKPPAERFTTAYDYFEQEWNFTSTWIRTDFRFATLAKAREIIGPVFGEAILETVIEVEQGVLLPECTGIWWRSV